MSDYSDRTLCFRDRFFLASCPSSVTRTSASFSDIALLLTSSSSMFSNVSLERFRGFSSSLSSMNLVGWKRRHLCFRGQREPCLHSSRAVFHREAMWRCDGYYLLRSVRTMINQFFLVFYCI
jgi:hypothetical protein